MSVSRMKMLQVSKCLIGLAVMALQSCETADNCRDQLCGNWESVEGKPDVLIYKEGEAYKVTVFKRSGLRRKLKPETYLLQEENGNLFMNTGFRIDVSSTRQRTSLPSRRAGTIYVPQRKRRTIWNIPDCHFPKIWTGLRFRN